MQPLSLISVNDIIAKLYNDSKPNFINIIEYVHIHVKNIDMVAMQIMTYIIKCEG